MTFGAEREIGFIIFKSSDNSYWNSISQKMAGNLYQRNFYLQNVCNFCCCCKSHTNKSSSFKSIVKGRGWGGDSLLVVSLIGSLIVSLRSGKRKEASGKFTNIIDENYKINTGRLAQLTRFCNSVFYLQGFSSFVVWHVR